MNNPDSFFFLFNGMGGREVLQCGIIIHAVDYSFWVYHFEKTLLRIPRRSSG